VAGVGAWLLGVGAATAGSLLAVSLLGQGIATSNNQQLTAAAVNNALAAEASDPHGTDPPTSSPSPAPSASPSRQPQTSQILTPQIEATPSAQASRSRAASSPSPQATASATSNPTVLSSQGGTVVADCRAGGAYLVSWSPDPGYEAGAVIRGPTVNAQVTFDSTASSVTMIVSCSAGVPTATSTVSGSGSYGGGGHDE
jgi:serine/threonine-protein kinase